MNTLVHKEGMRKKAFVLLAYVKQQYTIFNDLRMARADKYQRLAYWAPYCDNFRLDRTD